MAKFNAQLEDQREQFNAQNKLVIEQFNAKMETAGSYNRYCRTELC